MSTTETVETTEVTETSETKVERRGRPQDTTPNKTFAAKKKENLGDGTALFEVAYNDEFGVRQTRTEIRPAGKGKGGKGRAPDKNPNKVFTPKFERGENGSLVLVVGYNDDLGQRCDEVLTLSVGQNGRLAAKIG